MTSGTPCDSRAPRRHQPEGDQRAPRARHRIDHSRHLLARHPGAAGRGGGADCGAGAGWTDRGVVSQEGRPCRWGVPAHGENCKRTETAQTLLARKTPAARAKTIGDRLALVFEEAHTAPRETQSHTVAMVIHNAPVDCGEAE